MSPKHPSPEQIRPVSALDAGLRVIADCERLKAVILATRLSDNAARLQANISDVVTQTSPRESRGAMIQVKQRYFERECYR
jgi:hypothetical protein